MSHYWRVRETRVQGKQPPQPSVGVVDVVGVVVVSFFLSTVSVWVLCQHDALPGVETYLDDDDRLV